MSAATQSKWIFQINYQMNYTDTTANDCKYFSWLIEKHTPWYIHGRKISTVGCKLEQNN